ncbi:MAG: tetratricopeptide repeat protein, partial [Pseudomonadota bacterium]
MNPPVKTGEARALIAQGLAHHRAGRLDEAERLYRQALGLVPEQADALHYLGVVLHQKGDSKAAVGLFEMAETPLGGNAGFHANFGAALKDADRWERAKKHLHRALALSPDHEEALFNLGLILMGERDHQGAADLFGRILARDPAQADATYQLGRALAGLGRGDAAVRAYRDAIRLDPAQADARLDLAEAELAAGRTEGADEAARAAAALAPSNLRALVLMAEICEARGDAGARRSWLDKARATEPEGAGIFFDAGMDWVGAGAMIEARRAFRRSLALDPGYVQSRWALHRALPASYAGEADIDACRARFETGLGVLEKSAASSAPAAALTGLAADTNFFLAYQERNDRDLQVRYGRLAARVVAARFPEFARALPIPGPETDGRLRVGFVSAYFRLHSVARLCAGWFEKLDRRRFRVFGYFTGKTADGVTRLIGDQCDVFRHMPPPVPAKGRNPADPFGEWFEGVYRAVAADRLHVLVFTDVGMDPPTFCLAASRLAPVQASCIGHPVTTGLPTMDYFLSGELIEPEGAEAHYSEKLVRLPNISLRLFDPGAAPGPRRRPRAGFGFEKDDVVYLCSQSLFKYTPRYDRIFPAVAKATPGARFVFIRSSKPEDSGIFLSRLARAFAAEGLERDRFCRFLDNLSPAKFGDLNHAADVFLDTPGWSGGNTTHEAISAGLPVVTLPGEFMRGRVSYGMLRMIGVAETVAADVDDYIAIAVRLGREPEFRARMRAQIEANRAKLYNDETCVRGL